MSGSSYCLLAGSVEEYYIPQNLNVRLIEVRLLNIHWDMIKLTNTNIVSKYTIENHFDQIYLLI